MRNSFFALILTFSFLGGTAFAAGPQCAELFAESLQPTAGADLGPIEMVRNLKQKFFPSKLVKNFDQRAYENSVAAIKSQDLRVENGFRPENLEQAIAYLDVQLESLSISIPQMPPVLRHKIYKTVSGVLKAQGRNSDSAAQGLANLIFRGSYTKPTSFYNILTHMPQNSGREMFVQHLHTLEVTSIVTAAYDYNSGPKKAGMIERHLPKFLKEHREIAMASLWGGISIYSTISSHSLESMFLPSLNIFKLKKHRNDIEQIYLENGLEATIEMLGVKYENTATFNFTYAVIEKAMNWYFFGSILTVFTGP
ncbi:hypothetical protein [Bdellovibrio sp. HCB2-146]|uniref:hypothetical protein n=1 Tax=Bdellovibrio sp. HCB2-146 TaxID=3394362 RepID=UPI0039BC905E